MRDRPESSRQHYPTPAAFMEALEETLKRDEIRARRTRGRTSKKLKLLPAPGLPPQKTIMRQPCENCPYRQDAPRNLWHRREFEGVMEGERSPLGGKLFACHKHAAFEDPRRRGYCAGWFLDQRKRGMPSVLLRASMSSLSEETYAQLEACNSEGLELFETVDAMCRANGVAERRRGAKDGPRYRMVKIEDGPADGKVLVLRTCEGIVDTYFDPTCGEPMPGPFLGVHRVTKLAREQASYEIVAMVARMLNEQHQLVQAALFIARKKKRSMTATWDGVDLAVAWPDGTAAWLHPPLGAPAEDGTKT